MPVAKRLRGLAGVIGLLSQLPGMHGRARHVGQRLVECGVGLHGLGGTCGEDVVLIGRGQRGPELGGVRGQGDRGHAPQAQVGHRGQCGQATLTFLHRQ